MPIVHIRLCDRSRDYRLFKEPSEAKVTAPERSPVETVREFFQVGLQVERT